MDIWAIILGLLQSGLSPALRALFKDLLEKWEKTAKETPSPIDDLVVGILKALLGF